MPFVDFNTKKTVRIWDGIYGTLAHSDKLTFGHFTIDEGTVLPEHSHFHEQWCHILEGELEFEIGGERMVLTSGMTAYIPSDVPHSAVAHTRCKVIDCFSPVRQDFVELEEQAQ
ncbi:cupin domain-containing protein [Dyadobacter bucti]|jgi:quercetin dioxygenase-like cupin family protein|uniref:cupin domain-containing protein n=1 Tax=Dyadobacter bucti TaxID=2572203 RepID=UPI001108A375|nr:cupin domain-containing protein [Dyadobacter bucti]